MQKILLVLLFIFSSHAFAKSPVKAPLIDTPFNFDFGGFHAPSMQQSMDLSLSYYYLGHYGMKKWADKNNHNVYWYNVGFDLLSFYVPFGVGWLHEEYHRAVMLNRNISSFNEVYTIPLFADVIKVSRVKDSDLIRLKREHPADQARLSAAGLESQTQMNLEIEKNYFFYDSSEQFITLWINATNNTFYFNACVTGDSRVKAMTKAEGTDVMDRDFTGFDCNAWVYDLHRPFEPYSARGVHPSGAGVDRYIKFSDLNKREQKYLKMQTWLSLLNFADPFLYRKKEFYKISRLTGLSMHWNWNIKHYPTSFGHAIDFNLFSKSMIGNSFVSFHNYFNQSRYFPGIELQILRKLTPKGRRYSLRTMIWEQPKDQLFITTKKRWGGLLSAKVAFKKRGHWEPYFELEAKSAGWVAGNVYLDKNLSLRVGATNWSF